MEESQESKPEEKVSQEAKKEIKKIEKPKGLGLFSKIKNKISQYKRVVNVSRKPEKEEFISSVKITGAGIILIGVIGFIIFLLYFLIRAVF
jgi:protein transport protein SEC61 subunit gamma-like protein